jgi:hypothetical protein
MDTFKINCSYAKNTKTKYKWALLIKEITNPMIVGQTKKFGRSAKGDHL